LYNGGCRPVGNALAGIPPAFKPLCRGVGRIGGTSQQLIAEDGLQGLVEGGEVLRSPHLSQPRSAILAAASVSVAAILAGKKQEFTQMWHALACSSHCADVVGNEGTPGYLCPSAQD